MVRYKAQLAALKGQLWVTIKRERARSYYPLLCTVAQTSQVLNFYHRPGNVHDSHRARDFMLENIAATKLRLPKSIIELRAGSAFLAKKLSNL